MIGTFFFALVLGFALLGGPPPDPAVATILNDTPNRVYLRLCSDNACTAFAPPPLFQVEPADTVRVNVSSRGAPNVYVVEDSQRRRTGCLPIRVRVQPGWSVIVWVSMQRPCTDEIPHEWPPSI